jgi:hypothetical protein
MKWPILRMKKYRLSLQQLDLILKSAESHSSFTIVKNVLNLPFETSAHFLKQFNIHDSFHFFEHVQILYTLKKISLTVKESALSLIYPLVMLLSSFLLLSIFKTQFERMLIPMNIEIPPNVTLIVLTNYLLIACLLILSILYIWIKVSLYRRVLLMSFLKKTKLFKIISELVLVNAIKSLISSQVSLKGVHTLISKHSNHSLMRIMSNDLNQIIEEGKTMMIWLNNYSAFPSMNNWLYEQINQSNHSNIVLWSNQLQLSLKQMLQRVKNILLTSLYGMIALNIIAMLTMFSLPYEWIHQL